MNSRIIRVNKDLKKLLDDGKSELKELGIRNPSNPMAGDFIAKQYRKLRGSRVKK